MICREHGRKYRFDRFQTHITELKAAWKLKGTRSFEELQPRKAQHFQSRGYNLKTNNHRNHIERIMDNLTNDFKYIILSPLIF